MILVLVHVCGVSLILYISKVLQDQNDYKIMLFFTVHIFQCVKLNDCHISW